MYVKVIAVVCTEKIWIQLQKWFCLSIFHVNYFLTFFSLVYKLYLCLLAYILLILSIFISKTFFFPLSPFPYIFTFISTQISHKLATIQHNMSFAMKDIMGAHFFVSIKTIFSFLCIYNMMVLYQNILILIILEIYYCNNNQKSRFMTS